MTDQSFQQFLDYLDQMEGQYGAPNEWYLESTPHQVPPMYNVQDRNVGHQSPIRQGYQPPSTEYQPVGSAPMGSFAFGEGRPNYEPGAKLPSCDRAHRLVYERAVRPMPLGNAYGGSGGKNIKPPTYDGQTSFRDFRVQFELVTQLADWTPSVMALELARSLKGTAVAVLSELQPFERTHYPSLVKALLSRFEPENQSQLFKAQLKSRIRRPGEGIPEVAQDIRRIVRNAYVNLPVEQRDEIARHFYGFS